MQSPRQRSKFIIGICALDKKSRSKPMRNIVDRLLAFNEFEAIIFGDKVILDEPVDSWPGCDFLISFFSSGFPLEKAIQYVKLRKPFCVNDLPLQQLLLDRRLVHITLDAIDVPSPPRLTLSRDGGPNISKEMSSRLTRDFGMDLKTNLSINSDVTMIDEDTLCIAGQTMHKPFVEKPVDSENHNIYIYYKGSGVRKLFRKIGNKSSEFCPEEISIRSEGSYVYEAFMSVDNAEDVKVYTIGPNYFHAETRKSPVVDGIVRRNYEGKEIRYVTALSEEEQEIARRVCMAFGQTICGFDLLRVNGKSYVIDVNGWSFVKGNEHYYDMCAKILRETFLRVSRKRKMKFTLPLLPVIENQWFLKKYIAVFRHADRTPKQKLKFHLVHDVKFFERFLNKDEKGRPVEEVMIRNSEKLHSILNLTMDLIENNSPDMKKLVQLRDILVKKLRHADTKLQLKPSFSSPESADLPRELIKLQIIVKWGGEFTHAGRHHSKELGENLRQELFLTNKALLDDIKIYSSSERRVLATSEIFLKAFMTIAEIPADFIKISKEMLDDNTLAKEQMDLVKKKIKRFFQENYISDECGEGLNEEVKKNLKRPRDALMSLIEKLKLHYDIMCRNRTLLKAYPETHYFRSPGSNEHIIPRGFPNTERYLANHKWCCFDSASLWEERWEKLLAEFLPFISSDNTNNTNEFTPESLDTFEPSKICELYDSLKYDSIHNKDYLEFMFTSKENAEMSRESLHQVFKLTKLLYDFVGPQEYGITLEEKLIIGKYILKFFFKHLLKDVREAKMPYGPSCRFYFTKESHVYPVLNIVLYYLVGEENLKKDLHILELDYLTQISFEIYERRRHFSSSSLTVSPLLLESDLSVVGRKRSTTSCTTSFSSTYPTPIQENTVSSNLASMNGIFEASQSLPEALNVYPTVSPSEFAIRIGLSSGANSDSILDLHMDQMHAISVAPRVWITEYIKLDIFLERLSSLMED